MKRIEELIIIKSECLEEYKRWHANPMPGVNEMIKACNIQNYTIFQRGDYMFAYYEYVGDDFEADMTKEVFGCSLFVWHKFIGTHRKQL